MIKNKISIVIATLNCQDTISKCITSTLAQTHTPLEVLVIDGGSKDKTMEILYSIKDDRLKIVSEEDRSIYDAWNKAIKICSGEWVCFVGGDDYWLNENCLKKLIESSHNSNFISAKVKIYNSSRDSIEVYGKSWNKKEILKGMFVAHPGSLHHYSLFENRQFDASYKISGDHEFLIYSKNKIKSSFLNYEIICMQDGGISRSKPFIAFLESFNAIKSNVSFGYFFGLKFLILIILKYFLKRLILYLRT